MPLGIKLLTDSWLLVFLKVNESLVLRGALRRSSVETIGGKLQKRRNRWRAGGGNELKTFQ